MSKSLSPEKDCTPRCRSIDHAEKILNCVCFATPSQLRSYSVWLCHNFSVITDKLGRNLLHVASSCGKWEIVEWLLKQCCVDVDTKDLESGWTALHRAFFYGQLSAARVLCMNGASLNVTDHEGFTPLDILLKDRLPYVEYLPSDPCDVYAWGSNFNYNLGVGHSKSKQDPEVLEVFRKDSIDLKQVVICKFHSAFLTTTGTVFTCGYGHGGRLGQDSEDISLVPSVVKGLGSQTCVQIAAGQDHLLLLLENGQVWSCGLNTYHQLGHNPPSERLLSPKPLSMKFLKGKNVCGIGAARFHSVIYTKDSVYTFGLNAGQLGHSKGDRTQINPRQVSGLYTEECFITHVETSDGATVCATNRGDVYVLHEYQIRKIASKQLEILKLSVVGGHLDSRCDVAGVREGGGVELQVALLTRFGKLYLWRQTDPYLRRCLFKLSKELIISNVHINQYSIGLITSNNEAYLGTIATSKHKRSAPPSSTVQILNTFSPKQGLGLTVLINPEDCHNIKVKKLPNIYRASSITSDCKGRNFAVLQSSPKMGLIELPIISTSTMLADFSRLLVETHIHDDFHDVVVKVDKREFAAHRYILSSRSEYFRKLFSTDTTQNVISLEYTRPEVFEQVLKYIYTNKCDFLTPNYEVSSVQEKENSKKSKSSAKDSKDSNPLQGLIGLSKRLNVHRLTKRLEAVKLVNGRVKIQDSGVPRLSFNSKALPNLCDVNLISSDGSVFPCHKCILISRLDYFHSMLNTCWAENSLLENLPLPMESSVLKVLIDYLYTDEATAIANSEDIDFICQVLMTSDQLLLPRLKEICEVALVKLISLKNAAELLELSSISNSLQLKRSSMQFICINLPAIIESKVLEVLSEDVMDELTEYYHNMVPLMGWRRILPCKRAYEENLELLEIQFPVKIDSQFEKNRLNLRENKLKRRRCTSLRSDMKEISLEEKEEKFSSPDVILKVVPDTIEVVESCKTPVKVSIEGLKIPKKVTKSPGQWIMHSVPKETVESLDSIMNETLNMTPLQKKSNSTEIKPLTRLSQRQKKLLEAEKKKSPAISVPNSSPSQTSCPWAKLSPQSPPSPSFWDAVARKEFPTSPLDRELTSPVKGLPKVEKSKLHVATSSNPSAGRNQDIVINFHEIQKDEEQKLQRAINQKIKPLSILNIEDQAIEELSQLYNANNNHKEKITIIRVPTEIATPIWSKSGH